jgi:rubrerythrin
MGRRKEDAEMKVIDFAIEMEERERDLYKELAQRSEKEGLRAIYARMAEDEEEIVRKLQAMASTGSDAESLALEGMVSPLEMGIDLEKALRLEDGLQAYRFLMEVEKAMRDFYDGVAQRESDPYARDLLLNVAAEEERELQDLESLYEFANAPNEFLAWGEFSNLDEFHNFGRYEDNRSCRHTH